MADDPKLSRLTVDDTVYETRLTRKYRERRRWSPPDPTVVLAFIPGAIRRIDVTAGQRVGRGEPLLVLEAMKMLNTIEAPRDLVVRRVAVAPNEIVAKGQLLLQVEPIG
jgi:biotin carboxyl carrier protein